MIRASLPERRAMHPGLKFFLQIASVVSAAAIIGTFSMLKSIYDVSSNVGLEIQFMKESIGEMRAYSLREIDSLKEHVHRNSNEIDHLRKKVIRIDPRNNGAHGGD